MRTIVMLLFLCFAGTCYGQDPLESLNTIEDTLSTMESILKEQGLDPGGINAARVMVDGGAAGDFALGDELYFVSEEELGTRSWILVRPCAGEGSTVLTARESDGCGSYESPETAAPLWKSRTATPTDLHPGVLVVAKEKTRDGGWYLAKVIDTSEIGSGYVTISAPFKAQLKNLRIVE